MKDDNGSRDGEGASNTGSNLFVTGIHPKLSEEEVTRLFSKYGNVEKCQIMRDPHTKESRGFGFVNFMTSEEADAAKEALQGKELEGRTLSIEKARRSRPRTPTPGKYFGPPKRGMFACPYLSALSAFTCTHILDRARWPWWWWWWPLRRGPLRRRPSPRRIRRRRWLRWRRRRRTLR